jgi:hypothetical protein
MMMMMVMMTELKQCMKIEKKKVRKKIALLRLIINCVLGNDPCREGREVEQQNRDPKLYRKN